MVLARRARHARRAVADREEGPREPISLGSKHVEHYHTPASTLDPNADFVVVKPEEEWGYVDMYDVFPVDEEYTL